MISASSTKIVLSIENLDEYKAKVKQWDSQKALNDKSSFTTGASPQLGQGNLGTSFGSQSRGEQEFDPNDPKQVADKSRRERLGIR